VKPHDALKVKNALLKSVHCSSLLNIILNLTRSLEYLCDFGIIERYCVALDHRMRHTFGRTTLGK
jgi:hypothetical protein